MMKWTFTFVLLALAAVGAGAQKVSEIRSLRVVGVPPLDAYVGLSKLPGGEIRHYNYGEQADGAADYSAVYGLSLDTRKLSADTGFHKIGPAWNLDRAPTASVTLDGCAAGRIPLRNSTIQEPSYIQFITSPLSDTHGLAIEEVSAEKL